MGAIFGDGTISIANGGLLRNQQTTASGAIAIWGSMAIGATSNSSYYNASGTTFASTLLTSGALSLDNQTTGFTPANCGTFTLNGVTQVNVAGTFPANAPIAWGLSSAGTTPGTQSPYFSAAQTANQFSVKSPTVNANDVYNWCAQPAPVTISAANLDTYKTLSRSNGAVFTNSTL